MDGEGVAHRVQSNDEMVKDTYRLSLPLPRLPP
nr:uncharacterized protein CTRU02_04175 [Colletotrichum truncatum]KAF6796214.1 hypothetical protein CTRU02_04175 [Colletotrichum truncatum]